MAGKKPLIDESGDLRRQIVVRADSSGVTIISSPIHAAIQQFGGDADRGHKVKVIPTHVGNAFAGFAIAEALPVHPHARGERPGTRPMMRCAIGSSPRTWGTRCSCSWRSRSARFIPTHVGNANSTARSTAARSVHPHARGERTGGNGYCRVTTGSSPRTWGTLEVLTEDQPCWRFIPTHVGNACGCMRSPRCRTVHPHARGERESSTRARQPMRGSSPRTWGTLRMVHCRVRA